MSLQSHTLDADREVDRLRKKMDVRKMLSLPFFEYITHNVLTDAQLRTFFVQYYSIVRTSYRMLAAGILSATPEDTFSVAQQVRFLATEAGGDPTHLGYYLRWADAFGVTAADLGGGTLNSASKALEDTLMSIYASSDAFDKLAAQLATEDCAAVLIEGLNEGFRRYRLSARAYGYLAAHLLLENDEDGHSRWAIDALTECPNLDARMIDIERTYERVYSAFANLFNGIYDMWSAAPDFSDALQEVHS
jgi:pyrroloquinoline quinone (PQQ) biosynthesis protein C